MITVNDFTYRSSITAPKGYVQEQRTGSIALYVIHVPHAGILSSKMGASLLLVLIFVQATKARTTKSDLF
jgi:hypothetical protein